MEVGLCSSRPILQPCGLEGHTYQVDPYVGCEHNCRYCYALNAAESDWTKRILVHEDIERRLAKELEGVEPQSLYMGMSSDPYQPVEEEERQTRRVLELLSDRGFSVCVLTKSPLITRDLDVFREIENPYLGFSIAFQDEDVRCLFEESAPSNVERLRALAMLRAEGIRTYVLICPVMPYLTDVDAVIDLVAAYVDHIYVYRLKMKAETDENWQNVEHTLSERHPELVDVYRRVAFSADDAYWQELRSRLSAATPPQDVALTVEV
jgi:DNA repair photolyase